MAIARCTEGHGSPQGRKEVYLTEPLTPAGDPESGVVCGIPGCENPAKLYITPAELKQYEAGRRVFGVKTNAVKVLAK